MVYYMVNVLEAQDLKSLKKEIVELRNQKTDLLEKIRQLESQRNKSRTRRDELNKIASESFAKVKALKVERDENNRSIQELKSVRRSVLEEMKIAIEKAKSLQEEIKSLDINENDFRQSKKIKKRIDPFFFELDYDIKKKRKRRFF